MVVQTRFREQVDDAAGCAGLRVARAVHNTFDAGMHNRATAHHAGFQRDIQRAGGQTVIGLTNAGIAQRHDFGMGAGIVSGNRLVETSPDNLAGNHQHCADRYFARRVRQFGLRHGGAHEAFVVLISHGFAVVLIQLGSADFRRISMS